MEQIDVGFINTYMLGPLVDIVRQGLVSSKFIITSISIISSLLWYLSSAFHMFLLPSGINCSISIISLHVACYTIIIAYIIPPYPNTIPVISQALSIPCQTLPIPFLFTSSSLPFFAVSLPSPNKPNPPPISDYILAAKPL